MRYLIILLTLSLSACTMMIVPGSPRGEIAYKPDEEIVKSQPVMTPLVIGRGTLRTDGECEPYVMLEREPYQTLDDALGNLDELDHNQELLIEKLFRYIHRLQLYIERGQKERRNRYNEYLRRCLTTQ